MNASKTCWTGPGKQQQNLSEICRSDYLVTELTRTLADPRFSLDAEAQATIVAEYIQHAEVFEHVPSSGAYVNGAEKLSHQPINTRVYLQRDYNESLK